MHSGHRLYLVAAGLAGGIVVVGYDGRHGSKSFAEDSAAVFAAAGFDARPMPRLLLTPRACIRRQHLGAAAGVIVTALHNPPQDNGYKVYAADWAQIVPPMDADIEARIRAVASVKSIQLSDSYPCSIPRSWTPTSPRLPGWYGLTRPARSGGRAGRTGPEFLDGRVPEPGGARRNGSRAGCSPTGCCGTGCGAPTRLSSDEVPPPPPCRI